MNLNELTPAEQAQTLKKLQELKASDGWAIIESIIASERETLFRKVSAPDYSTDHDFLNYTRGVIEGSYRLAELPSKAITLLENALLVHAAKQKATSSNINQTT